jgi:hypothetical protein
VIHLHVAQPATAKPTAATTQSNARRLGIRSGLLKAAADDLASAFMVIHARQQ